MYANQVTSFPVAAEFCGRQYTRARYLAAVYRYGLRCVVTYRIDVSLVPGHSGRDPLASIADALRARPFYPNPDALRTAIRRAAGEHYGRLKIVLRCLDRYPSQEDREAMGITVEQIRQYEASMLHA